jgi:hypothetical protein
MNVVPPELLFRALAGVVIQHLIEKLGLQGLGLGLFIEL